ncbi:MAG: GTP cyclohydrolase FolE2 [Acidobacteriota bacterium]
MTPTDVQAPAAPAITEDPQTPATGLADIQNTQDERNIAIDKVGVKNIRYPIVVADRSNGPQNTVGNVNMYVDLPHHFKGTHMSRFLEVLSEHHGAVSVEQIPNILDAMLDRLDAETAHFSVDFTYFIKKKAPVTGAEGLMGYECSFEASRGRENDFILSVQVPVTTLCPCSKEISARGAHNQRGNVDVRVRFDDLVWIEDIIEMAEASASCALFPILKRPDEKWVTETAYDNPRFVEDMVREVTLRLQADERIRWFEVQVENFESIHAHNAYAMVERWVDRS